MTLTTCQQFTGHDNQYLIKTAISDLQASTYVFKDETTMYEGKHMSALLVVEAVPQGEDAMSLLRLARADARALYPELHPADAPEPTNEPTPQRGVYLVAYREGIPVAMGAHRPVDEQTTEIRRMYVRQNARRTGAAREILHDLETHARKMGFASMVLETGFRQIPAMRLYESFGFTRIPPFGAYVNDPTSVCFGKVLEAAPSSLNHL